MDEAPESMLDARARPDSRFQMGEFVSELFCDEFYDAVLEGAWGRVPGVAIVEEGEISAFSVDVGLGLNVAENG